MANAADAERVKRDREREELAQRTSDDDFLWLMSEPRGRRFLWQLIGLCNVFKPVFNTHGGIMNFNEGRRDVGLFLLGRINTLCPHLYAVAAAENAPQIDDTEEVENDD
ncbi:MAG: hypothetical protein COA41_11305 [Sphingopyxis sp.]|nr:MAG: hypothetical protein COA41_11305 [Sphingopyxis sp.]